MSKSRKFALYFIKMVLKTALYENSVKKFTMLAANPEHKEVLCMYITYKSFLANMV